MSGSNISVWNDGIIPEGYPYDPITMSQGLIAPTEYGNGVVSTVQPSGNPGAGLQGYAPSWKYVPPPGIGDAPQHVWSTFSLIPVSIDGPGDRPAGYLRSYLAPIVQNFRALYNGIPIEGGNFLLTGLYTPQPLTSPGYSAYAGATGL
jgi:hypothetical protein